ncbi:MAG TPA: hypothetical protein VFH51_05185, partial [Myxococcota bacterium]|nr:hypothetical protein [Myxococcota bacterium]
HEYQIAIERKNTMQPEKFPNVSQLITQFESVAAGQGSSKGGPQRSKSLPIVMDTVEGAATKAPDTTVKARSATPPLPKPKPERLRGWTPTAPTPVSTPATETPVTAAPAPATEQTVAPQGRWASFVSRIVTSVSGAWGSLAGAFAGVVSRIKATFAKKAAPAAVKLPSPTPSEASFFNDAASEKAVSVKGDVQSA